MSTVRHGQLESSQEYSRQGNFGFKRLEPVEEKEDEDMTILKAHWFTDTRGCFGVVVGVDENTGKKKAYIGHAQGISEDADTKFIAEQGSKLTLEGLKAILADLEE